MKPFLIENIKNCVKKINTSLAEILQDCITRDHNTETRTVTLKFSIKTTREPMNGEIIPWYQWMISIKKPGDTTNWQSGIIKNESMLIPEIESFLPKTKDNNVRQMRLENDKKEASE